MKKESENGAWWVGCAVVFLFFRLGKEFALSDLRKGEIGQTDCSKAVKHAFVFLHGRKKHGFPRSRQIS